MEEGFDRRLRTVSHEGTLPDGSRVPVLEAETAAGLAEEFGLARCEAEADALALGVVPAIYLKNIPVFGLGGQARLLSSMAALVGLGGLGGGVLECLLRLGVGHVRVADGDRFEESNLNRQILCTRKSLGRSKAKAARKRAAEVNAACGLEVWQAFLGPDSFDHFLSGAGVALDALGGFAGRAELVEAAGKVGIPLVTGAINGQAGFVAVVAPGGPGPWEFMGGRGDEGERQGSPATTAMAVAAVMASQAAAVLAHGSAPLEGRMLLMDLAQGCFDTVTL